MSKSVLVAYAMVPVLFVLSMIMIPGFGSWPSIVSLLVIASLLGIASIGQTLTVLLGGIDLSIPAIIGLANVLTVRWYGAGLPFPLVVILVIAVAMAIGAASGLLSRVLNAHPLLVTLAASFMILGAVLVYTEGQTVGTVPDYLLAAVSPASRTGPIPLPPIVVVWFSLTLLIVAVEQKSILGRYLFATGANERSARLALVPVTLVWAATFAVSAGGAGIAGILLAGFSGGADASALPLPDGRRRRRRRHGAAGRIGQLRPHLRRHAAHHRTDHIPDRPRLQRSHPADHARAADHPSGCALRSRIACSKSDLTAP